MGVNLSKHSNSTARERFISHPRSGVQTRLGTPSRSSFRRHPAIAKPGRACRNKETKKQRNKVTQGGAALAESHPCHPLHGKNPTGEGVSSSSFRGATQAYRQAYLILGVPRNPASRRASLFFHSREGKFQLLRLSPSVQPRFSPLRFRQIWRWNSKNHPGNSAIRKGGTKKQRTSRLQPRGLGAESNGRCVKSLSKWILTRKNLRILEKLKMDFKGRKQRRFEMGVM